MFSSVVQFQSISSERSGAWRSISHSMHNFHCRFQYTYQQFQPTCKYFGVALLALPLQSRVLYSQRSFLKQKKLKLNNVCVREIKRNLHLSVVSSAYKVHIFGCGYRFYVDSNRHDKTNKDVSNHHLELVFNSGYLYSLIKATEGKSNVSCRI